MHMVVRVASYIGAAANANTDPARSVQPAALRSLRDHQDAQITLLTKEHSNHESELEEIHDYIDMFPPEMLGDDVTSAEKQSNEFGLVDQLQYAEDKLTIAQSQLRELIPDH